MMCLSSSIPLQFATQSYLSILCFSNGNVVRCVSVYLSLFDLSHSHAPVGNIISSVNGVRCVSVHPSDLSHSHTSVVNTSLVSML